MANRFSEGQLHVIKWAAEECERQRSGEESVAHMLNAWNEARYRASQRSVPTENDILEFGRLVEPVKNAEGYRRCGVRVGSNVKGPWEAVPRQMAQLVQAVDVLSPEAYWFEFERIHPFIDGNGRVGSLLYCWRMCRLGLPIHSPDWDDPIGYWGSQDDYAMIRAAEAGWAAYRGERQGGRT